MGAQKECYGEEGKKGKKTEFEITLVVVKCIHITHHNKLNVNIEICMFMNWLTWLCLLCTVLCITVSQLFTRVFGGMRFDLV